MIKLGIGVAWTFGKINRFVSNMILAFRTRVAADGGVFEAPGCLEAQLEELRKDQLLSSTSLVVTPNAVKEGILYDIVPNTALGDLSVTRATTATRVNSAGLVEVVPYNLLQYSNVFNNGVWSVGSTITLTSGQVGYDGTNNAWLLSKGALQYPALGQSVSSSGTKTLSIYAKANTNTKISLLCNSSPSSFYQDFNLSNGTLGPDSFGVVNALIENVGNGWYRCSVVFSGDTTSFIVFPDNIEGANAGSVYIQNAQIVSGSVAKDYLRTETRLNIPRLDYTNGSCPSILVEPQRTNLFLNSVFNGTGSTPTSWSVGFATGTSAPAVSTKSTGVQAYTFTTSASRQTIVQLLNYVSGTTYACSVYVENVTGTISVSEVLFFNGTGTQTFYKDGVLISSSTPIVSGSRYTAIFLASATLSQQVRIGNGCTTTTTGSVRLSMPQLETGANSTSYIPTTSASVTRNADVISKTGISSLIGQTEGTVFVDANLNVNTNERRLITISNGTETQRIFVWTLGTTLYTTFNSISVNLGNFPIGTAKIAIGYTISGGNTTYSIKVNNNALITGTAAAAPNPLSAINLGSSATGVLILTDRVNLTTIWKTRLTNSELATLTTI
jgi:hypothetical protein